VIDTPTGSGFLRDFVYIVQAVGFPIAVAIFLLWRLNGKLIAFVESAQSITTAMALLAAAFQEHRSLAIDLLRELHEHRQEEREWVAELRRTLRGPSA
jgi:hypothetical protein